MRIIGNNPYSPSMTLYSKFRCFSTSFSYLHEHRMLSSKTCCIRRKRCLDDGGCSIQLQRTLNIKVRCISRCDNLVILFRNQQQTVVSSFYQSYYCSSQQKVFLTTDSGNNKDGKDVNLSTATPTTSMTQNMDISNQGNTENLENTNSNCAKKHSTLQEVPQEEYLSSTRINNVNINEKESIQK